MASSLSTNIPDNESESTINEQLCKNELLNEELLKIRQLDASIYDLDLQIEKESNDLTSWQIENRKKLKEILLSNPPESGSLANNTRRFLDLYTDMQCVETHNETKDLPKLIQQGTKNELIGVQHSTNDAACPSGEWSLTDEEKQHLECLLQSNSNVSTKIHSG